MSEPTTWSLRERNCRGCQGGLDTVLSLGALQLTGFLRKEEGGRPKAPLDLAACRECGLVQLRHTVPREALFTEYWYHSGVNEQMRDELAHVVDDAVARVAPLLQDDVVLDIGANDGTLLAAYARHEPRLLRVAYEPAANLQEALIQHAELCFADYFPAQYRQIVNLERRVKIITSIAMIYGVDDLAPFLTAVAALLHRDGVWVVQFQDLAGMLRATAFDNICHEHLTYPSLASVERLLQPYGLVVTDAQVRAINGGSYRLIIQHKRQPVHWHVGQLRQSEEGCQDWASLERFAWRVSEVKRQIRAAVEARRRGGQVVDLYGASTKANTLLQVCELGKEQIRQAWERSKDKVGRRTAGSDIPIVSEKAGRKDPPGTLLVGIWQFRDAVLRREWAFLEQGGTLLFPLPAVDTVVKEQRRGEGGGAEGRRVHA